MAYDNTSVFKLKTALLGIDTNPNKLNKIINNLDTMSWDSSAISALINALEDLKSNYNDIKKIKEKGNEIAKLIEQYKDIEKNIRYTKNKLSNLYSISDKDEKERLQTNYENDLYYYKNRLSDLEKRINNYL